MLQNFASGCGSKIHRLPRRRRTGLRTLQRKPRVYVCHFLAPNDGSLFLVVVEEVLDKVENIKVSSSARCPEGQVH
jgi:hypothetical protein